jgi:hypothetical protein
MEMEHAGVAAPWKCGCRWCVQGSCQAQLFKGAALHDPHGLFNAGLEAKATRAIDIHEGDTINVPALQELIRVAVAQNAGKQKK